MSSGGKWGVLAKRWKTDHVVFGGIPLDISKLQCASDHSLILRDVQPINSGHVIVIPKREVGQCCDLNPAELADLFATVMVARKNLGVDVSANLAIKDGAATGPPIGHVHVHLIPRHEGDCLRDDRVFERIDAWSPNVGEVNKPPVVAWPADATRTERTSEIMASEAQLYREALQGSGHSCASFLPTGIKFSRFNIADSQVFYASRAGLSVAIVNLKPLQPGHVLVIPRRVVPMMSMLEPEEIQDLVKMKPPLLPKFKWY
jgi:diadenosine tetraphosphate (Ap4A) HIT family hydrolase